MPKFESPNNRPYFGLEAFQNGTMSDIILTAREVEFKVHRLALFQGCPNLKDQLSNANVYVDEDPNLVKLVLTYIYCNEVEVPEERLTELATVARNLGVQELFVWCTKEYLKRTEITPQNCLCHLAIANETQDEILVNEILYVAIQNFSHIKQSASFLTLSEELFKMLILHKDLMVGMPDERISAALNWAHADPSARRLIFQVLYESQVMQGASTAFLDHILDDPIIQELPDIQKQIQESLRDTTGAGPANHTNPPMDLSCQPTQPPPAPSLRFNNELNPPMTDASPTNPPIVRPTLRLPPEILPFSMPSSTERYLVFAGARISGERSQEVYVVRRDHNLQVVSLGKLDAKVSRVPACCVFKQKLYMSGLGDSEDEVWQFDLHTKAAECIARLQTGRYNHAMTALGDGCLLVLGGRYDTFTPTRSVETVDLHARRSNQIGKLRYSACVNLVCCHVDDKVLVCGGLGDNGYHSIQVWDMVTSRTTHTIRLPYQGESVMYGAVQVWGELVVVAMEYTCVCRIEDVLKGNEDGVRKCDNYVSPNWRYPAVVPTSGQQTLMLLGGKPKDGHSDCYVYEANVNDILHNTGTGWVPVDTAWALGECQMEGGYDLADIMLP